MNATAERILDAAEDSYLEHGPSGTTLTGIARRAGVSRPTVYKHLGDLETIAATLLARELDVFFDRLEEVLDRAPDAPGMLTEGLHFTVTYARDHDLLQRLLTVEPLVVLNRFTREAVPVMERGMRLLEPRLAAAVGAELPADLDPAAAAELAVRTALSLVTTPSPRRDLDDPEQVADFVAGSLPLLGAQATRR